MNNSSQRHLSMPVVEKSIQESLKKLSSPPKLIKQKIYTQVVSLWEIENNYFEITQTSNNEYIVYPLNEEDVKNWKPEKHPEWITGNRVGK